MSQIIEATACSFCDNTSSSELISKNIPSSWQGYFCIDKLACQGRTYSKILQLVKTSLIINGDL